MDYYYIAFLLLAGHWLADYPLQGDFLVRAKQCGPHRIYHLIAHAGIHGGMVALITGSAALGAAELIVHAIIDEAKTKGFIGFYVDQILHIASKIAWISIIILY